MRIITSSNGNIFFNLAVEEYLLSEIETEKETELPILFLWTASDSVVIGRHQNPWKECAVSLLAQDSVPLARRISGGGTVFHDLGNLNYSIITDREKYDENEIYGLIKNALAKFAITPSIEQKSNLCVEGRKFSGTAFTFRKKRALHHGTLLVNANLARLKKYLRPELPDITTKAVSSRPAKTVNLAELNPEITIETLSNAIIAEFSAKFANTGQTSIQTVDASTLPQDKIAKFAKKLKSDDWIYGMTPKFTLNINETEITVTNGKLPN